MVNLIPLSLTIAEDGTSIQKATEGGTEGGREGGTEGGREERREEGTEGGVGISITQKSDINVLASRIGGTDMTRQ